MVFFERLRVLVSYEITKICFEYFSIIKTLDPHLSSISSLMIAILSTYFKHLVSFI